jgi:hypothetical protein
MTIDKRINFRGGGMDAGAGQDFGGFSGGDNSPAAGGTTGGTTGGNNNNNNGGGSDNRPTMADIAGPVTAPTTSLPSNIGFNPGFTLSTDPMDIKEQYRIGNPSMTIPGGPSFVRIDDPYMSQGLETNRYNNYLGAQNLRGYIPDPINIPFMPLVAKGLGILQKFGNEKNTQFFADNVAGKYGYGYGVEDFKQYMQDRMSGKVGAYGNEEQGQNALSRPESGIAALQGVSTIPQFLTGGEETDELISEDNDMYFNFGTFSNPIYKKDLV